jgi:methylated-DNA-protein-cysteine methyltransferase related protein
VNRRRKSQARSKKALVDAKSKELDLNRSRVLSCIRSLPKGKVSSYGAIARAAGWIGGARQVARVLSQVPGLPWHRVLGSGGAIKCPGEYALEQRFRLQMEGVAFRGKRVDMKLHEFKFSKASRVQRRKG